ncbi:MAG: S46 family peptidase [Taibaiella sp.]|nr:S46 family peptidase [Taibaiella sp.]
MKLRLLSSILIIQFIFPGNGWSQGGMWPVYDLPSREADMQNMGLQLPIDQLYNEANPALNQAVVLFGGGCTGEIISKNGLLFTNHHCGYSYGQKLSTSDQNILTEGFWAMNMEEELPCPGLEVGIVRKTIDVTESVLSGVDAKMTAEQRNKKIEQNIANYEKAYLKLNKNKVIVKPYFDGHQYYANEMETFTDVRLVGFPPNGIGKFGGDTDNWMWPRHTGDFAVFRIYADKNNQPAKYSKENIPYQPKKYFSISTQGVEEGNFSMVYGFPYRTTQFISSYQVRLIQEVTDPIRVNARGAKLAAWDKTMRKDQGVFLKYAAKQSSISNGWKKWQGEIRGLELNDVIGKKEALEIEFQRYVDNGYPEYKGLLAEIQALILANQHAIAANEIIRETVLGIEIVTAGVYLDRLMDIYRADTFTEEGRKQAIAKLEQSMAGFYKNYDLATDQNAFDTLMPVYFNAREYEAVPAELEKLYYTNAGDFKTWRKVIYDNTFLNSYEKMKILFSSGLRHDTMLIQKDPAYQIYHLVTGYRDQNIKPKIDAYEVKLSELNRLYTEAQLKTNVYGKQLYPDANQTLRLTYGPVQGIRPYGSNTYSYLTTLDEVMVKTNPDVEEFNTPQKLIRLYLDKDYGRWESNGTVPVCFLAQNHTSGGNSGSPVLNAKGELIGVNFDRIWDGTMSDIYYDPRLCRNISVDIRYVMFIIEKFGNASWLFKEMDIK